MFLATLNQIVTAPKSKTVQRSSANKGGRPTKRERLDREKGQPKPRNAGRSASSMAMWKKALSGKVLTAYQLADSVCRSLAGTYSAIHRLKKANLIKVAYEEKSQLGGRPILFWTWRESEKESK